MSETDVWPELPPPYGEALRSAVEQVEERTDPTGIVVAGSVVGGKFDPASDLDLYVLHSSPWRQRIQRFHAGVACEIFINPASQVERYFEIESRERRPITAHMLATGFVVRRRGPEVDALVKRARAIIDHPPEVDPQELTSLRYFAAMALEDGLDVLDRDPPTAMMHLAEAVDRIVRFLFAREGLWLPRPKERLGALDAIDDSAGGLARAFFAEGSVEHRARLASELADRAMGVRGFFEWEMKREAVSQSP